MYTEPQPFSAGFWDRDTKSSAIRRAFITNIARGCLITSVAILAILSIFWGAFWKVATNIHKLNAWVVDFDGGTMGQMVQSAALEATGVPNKLSWSIIPASQFPNGPADVIKAVLDEKCWVAIVVNPGASAALDAAVSSVNASYDGSSAATLYAAEARNENSFPIFVSPLSIDVITTAAQRFATQHAQQLVSHPNMTAILANAPTLLTKPLYFTFNNLIPFDVFAATASDFVGIIYLLLTAFILTNIHMMTRMQSGLEKHLSLGSLIGVRIFVPIVMYFFLSLIYSFISLAFQIPFTRKFGHGGFVVFWMLAWTSMAALGLALEAMITLLTPRFVVYFLILLLIGDVAVSFYPLELLPGIYRYGYAAPFYNVSRAVRTIIFGTRDQVGLNFGVQFGWIALSMMTIPVIVWWRRRQVLQEIRAKNAEEKTL